MTAPALNWGVEEERRAPWQTDDECDADAGAGVGEHSFNVMRNPRVFGGMAVIGGTRIPVFMIEDLYNDGVTVETILDYYPNLTEGQVFAALAYADMFAGMVAEDRATYEAVAQAHGD